MYYTDSYYEIGSSHEVCQDYAATCVRKDMAIAAISDGCSASHKICGQTDVGARAYVCSLLSQNMACCLNLLATDTPSKEEIADIIGNRAFLNADTVRVNLGLSPYALDATLGVALFYKDRVIVIAYGDLDFVVKTSNIDAPVMYNIVYESGAPYYLTYDYDTNRGLAYREEFGKFKVRLLRTYMGNQSSLNCENSVKELGSSPYEWRKNSVFEFKSAEWIALFTDGLRSFQKQVDKAPGLIDVSSLVIANHLTSFKNFKGCYVIRRMNMFRKRIMMPDRLLHYDDLGIAAICRVQKDE